MPVNFIASEALHIPMFFFFILAPGYFQFTDIDDVSVEYFWRVWVSCFWRNLNNMYHVNKK